MAEIGQEGLGALQKAKRIGSRFFFNLFLEMFHDSIVEQFREYLADYTDETMKDMVLQKRYPHLQPEVFRNLHGFETYLETIKSKHIFEALAEARPDLAEVLYNMGDPNLPPENKPGLLYIKDFRKYFLEQCLGVDQIPDTVEELLDKPHREMVTAKCEECGNSWPVPKEEFNDITKCPFCHTGKDQPPPQLA